MYQSVVVLPCYLLIEGEDNKNLNKTIYNIYTYRNS